MSSARPHSRSGTQTALIILLVGLGIVATAIVVWRRESAPTNPQSLTGDVLVATAPYTVTVTPSASRIAAGDMVRLHFTVRQDGVVSDIYREEKVLHYAIASANYLDFVHTFAPEVSGPGEFYLDHTFTQPGRYRIWTELVDTTKGKDTHHGEHAALISYVDLTVDGTAPTRSLQLVRSPTVTTGQWRVVTERTGLRAGQPTTIRLHVEDSAGTTLPVFPAEPAIYVMVGPDLEFFRHTHTQPAIQETTIELTETFPAPGTYLFFTEIYVREGDAYHAIQVPFELTIS